MRWFLYFFLVGFFWISCSEEKNPVAPVAKEPAFGIYFLQDSSIKIYDVMETDINSLKLASEPWISDKDIRFYDWSSHCIYLKKDKTHFFPNWENNKFNKFPLEWTDKPFVVVANSEKCYVGYFEHIELSNSWIAPTISDGDNSGYPSDVLLIDWLWLYHNFPQDNPVVKKALIEAELYHAGLTVAFDTTDTNTLRMIENADTSTISYKFTITNKDVYDLYIIDPDKTGSALFHWFTNGPVFINLETKKIYESRWKTTAYLPSLDYWSPDWFIKLKGGESIQRTVILKGYPFFPTGEYLFEFRYSGPVFGMEKETREPADSHYWLGPTRSNILVWNFKANRNSLVKIASQQIFEKHIQNLNLRVTPTNN